MRKFKQVLSLGHQMPLTTGLYSDVPSPEGVVREGVRAREWSLYGEVNCIMCNGHIGTLCGQTGMTENITFPQLRWRVVIRSNVFLSESNSRSVRVSIYLSSINHEPSILTMRRDGQKRKIIRKMCI